MRFSRIAMGCDLALIVSQVMTQRRVDGAVLVQLRVAHWHGALCCKTYAQANVRTVFQSAHTTVMAVCTERPIFGIDLLYHRSTPVSFPPASRSSDKPCVRSDATHERAGFG